MKDNVKFITYQLAEQCHMTVKRLRHEVDLSELVDWIAYRRYVTALQDQAREKVVMQREATKKRGHRRR